MHFAGCVESMYPLQPSLPMYCAYTALVLINRSTRHLPSRVYTRILYGVGYGVVYLLSSLSSMGASDWGKSAACCVA